MFKRKRPEAPPQPVDLEVAFGTDLAPRIVEHLGEEKATELARSMVAEGKSMWSTDLLSDEDREQISKTIRAAGVYKVEDRAKFFAEAVAEKVAQAIVPRVIAENGLPPDMESDLILDFAALLYSGLDITRP